MAENKITKLVESIGKLTVLELSELVKAIEEKFDVQAVAPMMMAGAAMPGGAVGPSDSVVEEKIEFDVKLSSFGEKKIQVIKVVRELTGLGLKEAKDLVESAPGNILEKIDKETAESAKNKLEEQGATIEIK